LRASKPDYAKMDEKFANRSPLQFTLREMRIIFSSPKFRVGFSAVILVLAISGPFYTAVNLNFPERLSYWLLISGFCFVTGLFISLFAGVWLHKKGLNRLISQTVAGLIAGLPIAGIVWLTGVFVFDFNPGRTSVDFAILAGQCSIISAAVALLFSILRDSSQGQTERTSVDQIASSFFKRLPVELGMDLICIHAQDHYLRVTTARGSEMVLMRMSDACEELADFEGMQVHRSWWISSIHVRLMEKSGGKGILTLSDGQKVPVSRGFVKKAETVFGS